VSVAAVPRASRVPLRGFTQVAVLLWAYMLYGGFRNLATGPTVVSLHDAEKALTVERFLHIDIEQSLQHFVLHFSWLVSLCNVCYSATHTVVPVAVLILLYRRTPDRYAVWRDTFLIVLGMALIAFALFPAAPPWLMPSSYHVADPVHRLASIHAAGRGAWGIDAIPSASDLWGFSNPFAAMPSLHTTWALWSALAAWPVVRRRWVKGLLVAYPPMMFLSVVVTANHWVLDALVGALMLAAAYGIACAIDQLRSAPFAWRRSRST
jgi:amino acid transporter